MVEVLGQSHLNFGSIIYTHNTIYYIKLNFQSLSVKMIYGLELRP